MGTKVSKLSGCESFSSALPSDAAGITEAICVEEVNFEGDSTGMLHHLEYMRSVLRLQERERKSSQGGFINGLCLPGFF